MKLPSEQDQRLLLELLDLVRKTLALLVNDTGDFVLLEFATDQERRADLKSAWRRVSERLDAARAEIDSPLEGDETRLSGRGPEDELVDSLEEAGLTGAELRVKHSTITRCFQRFRAKGTSLWLRRLLGGLNSFLGSLAEVIPGVGTAKELKDTMETTLKVERRKKS